MLEYSIEESYRELGGFVVHLKVDQDEADFIEQVSSLEYSEFVSTATISAIVEILFYNKVTNSFIFIALHAHR